MLYKDRSIDNAISGKMKKVKVTIKQSVAYFIKIIILWIPRYSLVLGVVGDSFFILTVLIVLKNYTRIELFSCDVLNFFEHRCIIYEN